MITQLEKKPRNVVYVHWIEIRNCLNWITNLYWGRSSCYYVNAPVWCEWDVEVIWCKCLHLVGRRANSPAVLMLAQRQYKHVAAEEATSTVIYLRPNLCLSERPYILFREWHLSSSTLWIGAGIWWGLEHAVLMDELVKEAPWCSALSRMHGCWRNSIISLQTWLITHS